MKTRFMLFCLFTFSLGFSAFAESSGKTTPSTYQHTVEKIQKNWNVQQSHAVSAAYLQVRDMQSGNLVKRVKAGDKYQINLKIWASNAQKNQFQLVALNDLGNYAGSFSTLENGDQGSEINMFSESSDLVMYWEAPAQMDSPVSFLYAANQSGMESYEVSFLPAGTPINSFPYSETFDALNPCNPSTFSCPVDCQADLPIDWLQGINGTDDDDDWRIEAGPTPSGTTSCTSTTSVGPVAANGGSGLYLYIESSGSCTGQNSELYSPQFDLTGLADPIFRYHSYLYGSDIDAAAGVVVEISTDNGMTWTQVDAQNGPQTQTTACEDWTMTDISLLAYLNQTVSFRLTGTTGTGFLSDIAIDDIYVGEMPTCIEPSAFTNIGTTSTSADFSWTPSGTESSWTLEAVAPGGMPGMGAGIEGTANSSPGALGGLSPNTTYDVYIRSNCGFTEVSVWIGPVSITTDCVAFTAPYTETFDNGGTIPNCWANTGTENWLFTNSGTGHINNLGNFLDGSDFVDVTQGDGVNGYFAWVDDSSPHNLGTTLLSPEVNMAGITNPVISFWYASNNEGDANGNVDFHVDVWDGAAWNDNLFTSNSNTVDWEQVFVDLSGLTITGPIQARFVVDETNGTGFDDDVALDQIFFGDAPSCFQPTNLAVSNILADQADITWDSAGLETGYIVEWGPSPLTPGMGMTQTASSTMSTITGLMGNTEYQVYVYSDCGMDGVSMPTGPSTFTTLCNAFVAPYTEDFEDGGMLDNCWSLAGSEPWLFTDDPGFNHINFNNDFICDGSTFTDNTLGDGTGYFAWINDSSPHSLGTTLISPLVDMSGITNPALSFFFASNDEGDVNGNVDFSVEFWDGAQWIVVFTSSENTFDWDEVVIDLAPYLPFSGAVQARFIVDENNGSGFDDDLALDDVTFGELPSCPPVTNLAAANIAPDNFDLSYTAGGSETEWLVEFGAPCFTPGTGTQITGVTTTTPNITGLSPVTTYDFYVYAICGPGDTSAVSGPLSVTTPASCPEATNFAGTVMGTDITLTWNNTETNHIIEWGVSGFTLGSGTFVNVAGLTESFTGLMFGTAYDFYISTDCGGDTSQVQGPLTLITPPGCGGGFFDTGGPSGNYSAFEDYFVTICPDNPGDLVTVSFTFVAIETGGPTNGCWDFIEIYDGTDGTAPLLFEGCGPNNTGNPANNLQPGDLFTAGNPSGCLTFHFVSDNIVQQAGWEANITCGAAPTCFAPTGLTAVASGSTIDVSWVSTDTMFNVEYGVAGFTPGSGTTVVVTNSNMVSIPGLMNGTEYDVYVTSVCGPGDESLPAGPVSATTAPGCGGGFFDTGGPGGTYQPNEDYFTTICPDTPGDLVTVIFTYADIETRGTGGNGCWDYLTVFDGPDNTFPNLGDYCGEESGDGGVPNSTAFNLAIGTSFTSTDPSGCLTFQFQSDGSVQETGWEASITCAPPPPCDNPTNLMATANGSDEILVSWDSTAMDYEVIYVETDSSVNNGTAVPVMGDTSTTLTGLMSNTTYDIYVVGICGPLSVSDTIGPVMATTDPSCGDLFTDTGGVSGNYSNSQDYTVTICPDIPGTVVSLSFTFVDIEVSTFGGGSNGAGCWDFLTIYDGPDANAISFGEFCGEVSQSNQSPSNPISLLLEGDAFTSSHPSGCLTVGFTSDGSVTENGWEADIICVLPPLCPDPGQAQVIDVAVDTAVFSWSSSAPEFLVEYGPAGFPLGSGTTQTVLADTSTVLDGLMEQTTYDAYVQAICTPVSPLIMTGVIDGPLPGGQPKALELFATQTITDLDQYGVGSANNGGGTDGQELTFPNDTIPACTFIYITNDSAGFAQYFGFNADYLDNDLGSDFGIAVNGDDAIEMFYQGVVYDVFGDIDVDGNGEAWEYLDGWAYRNDGVVENNAVFDTLTWSYTGPNALDGDTLNSTSANPFPLGTWESPISCPTGPISFTTPCAPVLGDSIQNPILVDLEADTTFFGNTANCYTNQIGNPSNDVFYQVNVGPCVESISVNTCGSGTGYDTFLRLLDAAGAQVASNDDACGLQSTINFDVIGGETYFVVVEGFSASNGNYELAINTVDKNITITPDGINDPLCNGDANGEILITLGGGVGPYTFLWSNGATTEDLTGLAAGDYTGTITDAEGCEIVSPTLTLVDPDVLEVDLAALVVGDPLCNGDANGFIDITTIGGTAPYSYLWSNGATTEDLADLMAGDYTGSITDANGCAYVSPTITLTDPPVLTATASLTEESLPGENDGAIDLTPAGGTPPYTYLWSNGATTEDLDGIPGGDYAVTVTDGNGCTFVDGYGVLTDVNNILTLDIFQVSPNPSDGAVTLMLGFAQSEDIQIDVINVLGQILYTEKVNAVTNLQRDLDLRTFAAGVYFVRVTSDGRIASREIILTR